MEKNLEKESNYCFLLLCALSTKLHLYICHIAFQNLFRLLCFYKHCSGIHEVNKIQNSSSETEVESQKLFSQQCKCAWTRPFMSSKEPFCYFIRSSSQRTSLFSKEAFRYVAKLCCKCTYAMPTMMAPFVKMSTAYIYNSLVQQDF